MQTWYFETSAVNHLTNMFTVEDAQATKHLQLNKGREWCISPVTLWEILMTTKVEQREKIIQICQNVFSENLLPSPAELVVQFIEKGMPKNEPIEPLVSNLEIAKTWKDLVANRNHTFVYEINEVKERVKYIQKLTKNLHQIIKTGDLIISSEKFHGRFDSSLTKLVSQLPFIKDGEPTTKEERELYKVSLYFILTLLCAGAELENNVISNFWNKLQINSTVDRIHYVIEKLSPLVHRGPFVLMALTAQTQAVGKYPRGLWYDAMHSIYVTYTDLFLTDDNHFNGFKDVLPEPILHVKVHRISDLEWSRHRINQFGMAY